MEQINDFARNPMLRTLVIGYCQVKFEEASVDYTDQELIQTYHDLLKEGKLNKLFESEYLQNN